jgi:hypothetical protein
LTNNAGGMNNENETVILYIAAGIIVYLNKGLFFEKDHIGNLLQINLKERSGGNV